MNHCFVAVKLPAASVVPPVPNAIDDPQKMYQASENDPHDPDIVVADGNEPFTVVKTLEISG